MRKIFRMAKAELQKIFSRPSMFLLTGILVFALVLSFFFFSPQTSTTKKTYDHSESVNIYTSFMKDYSAYEKAIIDEKNKIELYLSDKGDVYSTFSEYVYELKYYMQGDDVVIGEYRAIIESIDLFNNDLTPEDFEKCNKAFSKLKTKVGKITDYMSYNIKDKEINFYFPTSSYERIYKELSKMYSLIPSEQNLESFNTKAVIDRYNTLNRNYDISKIFEEINSFEKIEIDKTQLQSLLDKYFYNNFELNNTTQQFVHKGKLLTYFNNITTDESDTEKLNEHVAKYFDYATICKELISNNFELLRISGKTDDQIANFVGYSDKSIYNLKTNIAKYSYFYENETFGYEYLNSFNFNVNSGTETNAYDFVIYALQILSSFIIIFTIFFAVGTISGEQSDGTLKMIATRPYTRNKIYSGKFLACFNVALILLSVSFVASLVIGFAVYGITFNNVLLVFNASKVVIINPIILMLIYLFSLFIDVVFYITLAIFISMIIKHTAVSTTLSSAIYIISTILLGTVNASWLRFIPSTNLQLFKFFTQSRTGFFSFSIVANIDLFFSLVIVLITTIGIDLLSRFLFTRRSIDKK